MQDDNAQPGAASSAKDDGKIKYAPYQGLSFYGHPSASSWLPDPSESIKIHYMGSEPVKRVYKNDAEIAKNKE